ncbi:MAG: DUF484 family protein [Parvibaculum sp.]|uniref:DUF484 family protein n=1 Tax=Parvibaculum sp. TaxID=2024848 RepID=UPI0025D94171|nr:DUF484 family protein [Parvibaculum sp.]MCE9648417.1 DUF484 family protein [Parvibaculum sp.]
MSQFNDRTEIATIRESAPTLSAAEVRAFLLQHPDFIAADADLIAALLPARDDGANVVDMQQFVIGKLQRQVRTLRDIQSDLIEASSLNSLAREQVHAAAIAMLDARSFEAFVAYVTAPEGLAQTLGLGAAAICVEAAHDFAAIENVRILELGGVSRMMGGDVGHRLVANVQGSHGLYGALAGGVQSEALVRLDFSRVAPPGLLALGGASAEQFHPDQAADLLEFLGRIVERCIRLWLDLPPQK